MKARAAGGNLLILCSVLALTVPLYPLAARATSQTQHEVRADGPALTGSARHSRHRVWMSCVPFARLDTGIRVSGNAWQWWRKAAGAYARGNIPELGSVLVFRANTRMRLGHVAVVSRVINRREIEVDQSNWAHRGPTRGTAVVDVSEQNDWTAVRVALGRSERFGDIYPAYGFIYDRPDDGALLVATDDPAPKAVLNPASVVLRAVDDPYRQVAEAPAAIRARVRHGASARWHARVPGHATHSSDQIASR